VVQRVDTLFIRFTMNMQKRRVQRVLWLGLFLVCTVALLRADDWPAAQIREQFSADRNRFVRITPGQSLGDTVGFAGSPKGPYAEAEFYERGDNGAYVPYKKVTLLNPVAPVDFFVTDSGFLVTLDNWHNVGQGKMFALYSPAGDLIRSYELADIFFKHELERFESSASSIWWHKGPVYLQPDQQSLFVSMPDQGGHLSFSTETGIYQYCETQDRGFVCRGPNLNRGGRANNAN
jgi:hypothetical protein